MRYPKTVATIVALSSLAAFSAFAQVNWANYIGPKLRVPSEEVRLFVDKNGCQYLIWNKPGSSDGNMIPRMRPDGKQECGQK